MRKGQTEKTTPAIAAPTCERKSVKARTYIAQPESAHQRSSVRLYWRTGLPVSRYSGPAGNSVGVKSRSVWATTLPWG